MLLQSILPVFIAFVQIGFSIAHPRPSPQAFAGANGSAVNFNGTIDAQVLGSLANQLGTLIDQTTQANEAGNGPMVLTLSYQMASLIPAMNAAVAAMGQDAFNVQGSQGPQQVIDAVSDVQDGNQVFGGIVYLLRYVWYDQGQVRMFLQMLKDTFVANASKFAAVTSQGTQDTTQSS